MLSQLKALIRNLLQLLQNQENQSYRNTQQKNQIVSAEEIVAAARMSQYEKEVNEGTRCEQLEKLTQCVRNVRDEL